FAPIWRMPSRSKPARLSRNARARFTSPERPKNLPALSANSRCSSVRSSSIATSTGKIQDAPGDDVALDFARAAVDRRAPRLQEKLGDVDVAIASRLPAHIGAVGAGHVDQQLGDRLQQLGRNDLED